MARNKEDFETKQRLALECFAQTIREKERKRETCKKVPINNKYQKEEKRCMYA